MKYRLIFAIALMTGAMGCSVDVPEVDQEESLKIVFEASPFVDGDGDADTRTSVIPNETYSNYEFIWSAKDTVGIYPDAGSQIFFTMENGAGASSATFDGGAWTCKEGHTFRSYFPFIGDIYLDATKIPVTFLGQKQVGNDNSDHFQKYDYMYTAATTKDSGFLNFSYSHLITAVLPWVELPAGHYTGLTLSLDEALFVTEGEYDLTAASPAIVGKKFSDSMSIELDVTFTSSDILKVYVPLAPMDMSGKTLTITITNENGREFQYTYEPSKPYSASKIYRLKAASSLVQPNNVIYYTSTDGNVVTPYAAASFYGTDIVSNEYTDGRGIITFDGDVTCIGWQAFFECSNLTSITIPDSVTSIEKSAFKGCSNLMSINIPDGVTSIDRDTFTACSNLMSINIPDGVTSIGDNAFKDCSGLTSINIPDGVTRIGNSAFTGCSSLTSINISDGVTSIGNYAFQGCSGLTSINIPEGVTSIGICAFTNCTSLTDITIPDSVMSIGFDAFRDCTSLTGITIPDGVKSIAEYTFSGCESLTGITIPDSVTSIGYFAFFGCTSLTNITIPDGVSSIGSSAFNGCSSLTSITIPGGVTSIEENVFSGCSSLTSINLPDSITSIGRFAFNGCSSLTSIHFPDGLTSIVEGAFSGCSSLTSINLPDSITSIGERVFTACSSLTSFSGKYASPDGLYLIDSGCIISVAGAINGDVIIPDGVTSIGYEVFCSCTSLTSITIPDSVTSIGERAFIGCSSLMSITVISETPPTGGNSMFYSTNNCPIYVPVESVETYKRRKYWSDYSDRIQAIPE